MRKLEMVARLKMKRKKGQILVVVLLVVVVSLAIGLSVASRNLTNLKGSTQAEQSQRAFTAAEGGVENTLSKLNDVATFISDNNKPVTGCTRGANQVTCGLGNTPAGIDANADPLLSKSKVVVTANNSYERTVSLGDVAQVNLKGMASGSTFKIQWAKTNTNETNHSATLEFTLVCSADNTAFCSTDSKPLNSYGQHREAVTIDATGQSGGFVSCGNAGVIMTTQLGDGGFSCSATITVPTQANLEILRLKPFWKATTVKISSVSGTALPVQTYDITSTATTDNGLTRKVQVSRDALPQLPAIFDYVLYSGGDIIK